MFAKDSLAVVRCARVRSGSHRLAKVCHGSLRFAEVGTVREGSVKFASGRKIRWGSRSINDVRCGSHKFTKIS